LRWWNSAENIVKISNVSGNEATIQPVAPGTATISAIYTADDTTSMDSATVTVLVRNFLIVHSEPGLGVESVGSFFELAAETHEKELRSNTAPGGRGPAGDECLPSDTIKIARVGCVSKLRDLLATTNDVLYLAYFGHSWERVGDFDRTNTGALFLSGADAPDTNLTELPGRNNTSPSTLPKTAFMKNAWIRLFGCKGATGPHPIAEQLARNLGVAVFGFGNGMGSLFTNDSGLGHFERAATVRERSPHFFVSAKKDVWMVPADGIPHFEQF
jgi:hypothetical protein